MLAKTFAGRDNKQVSSAQSYAKLRTSVVQKMNALKAIDAQIARVTKLSQMFAHRETVGGNNSALKGGLGDLDDKVYAMISEQLTKNTGDIQAFVRDELSEHSGKADPAVALMAADLKDYVGTSATDINATIDAQTKELRNKAVENTAKLRDTLAMQRRIIAESLTSGKGMADLENHADKLANSVDVFVESMAQFGERVGYMQEYSSSEPSKVHVGTFAKSLSLSQRLVLVGLKQDRVAWDTLGSRRSRRASSTVQAAITSLLDNTRTPSKLLAQERAAVNAAMQAGLAEVVGFSLFDEAGGMLTDSQKKTLIEMKNNPQVFDRLDDTEKATVRDMLAGNVQLREMDNSMRQELNEAMVFQRALTGFSHSWDDDGDGLISPTEQVRFIMDTAAPPTLPAGKVLAPFRTAALVPMETAKDLLREYFGLAAANKLAAIGTSEVTAKNVLDIILVARRHLVRRGDPEAISLDRAVTMFEWGDAVSKAGTSKDKSTRSQGWRDVSLLGLQQVSDTFLNEVDNPVMKGGLTIARDAAMAFAQGRNPLLAALISAAGYGADVSCETQQACTGSSCMSVVNDVSSGASIGGLAGGVGAMVGGGLGFVKSALTGRLGECASGVAKNIESAISAGIKFVKTALKFVGKTVGKLISSAVDVGRKIIYSAVKAGKTVVEAGVRVLESAGRHLYTVGSTLVELAGDVFNAGFNVVKNVGESLWNAGVSVVKSASSFVGRVTGWWRRRRNRLRQSRDAADGTKDRFTSSADTGSRIPSDMIQMGDDMAFLATAALNLYAVADRLYFNGSTGIPEDLGTLSYPDIAAKYANDDVTKNREPQGAGVDVDATILLESLTVLQRYTMKKVDLDAQIQTTAYLTDTVGRCLLEGACDLQDNVDRYALALDLMKSRRNDAVFSILEDMTAMNSAFQFEEATPEVLAFSLPDSPSLGDLAQQLNDFDDVRAAAKDTRTKTLVPRDGLVYYSFNVTAYPDTFTNLAANGNAHVIVPAPPANTKYRDARVLGQDVRAYMYPSTSKGMQVTTSVQITKGSYSTFVPIDFQVKPTNYFHTGRTQDDKYSFTYDASTCMDLSQPQQTGTLRPFRTSPYGEWRIELAGSVQNLFARATHLRIAFKVRWYEHSSFTSEDGLVDTMFGKDPCSQGKTLLFFVLCATL